MWTSDESVGPRAPVGACFNLLSLSKKGQERSKSRWASSPASIHPSSVERSLSVGRSALRQALCLPSCVPPSIGLSVFRWPLRLPSGISPSVEFSFQQSVVHWALVPRWAFRPSTESPPSAGRPALRRALCSLSGYLSSVGHSALHRGLSLPLDAPPNVEFSISAITRPLSVSPSFEQFEDCVINRPTG